MAKSSMICSSVGESVDSGTSRESSMQIFLGGGSNWEVPISPKKISEKVNRLEKNKGRNKKNRLFGGERRTSSFLSFGFFCFAPNSHPTFSILQQKLEERFLTSKNVILMG